MSGKWTACGAHLSRFAFLILILGINGCFSLNSEGLALLHFRAKVKFDPSGALGNWNENDYNPCMWLGVHCLYDKVHMLDLNGYDLKGVLAPELGNLSHLRVLDLSKNHFSGAIPQELGQLGTLEVLDLRDNKLTGTVPSELGQLQSLKRLLLCNNRFKQSIHVEIAKLGLLADPECDDVLTTVTDEVSCVNRKFVHCIWPSVLKQSHKSNPFQVPTGATVIRYLSLLQLFKFASNHDADDSHNNLTDLPQSSVIWNVDNEVANVRRVLAEQQSHNLPALPANGGLPPKQQPISAIPSRSSGSFPAVPRNYSPAPFPSPLPPTPTHTPTPAPISQEHQPPPVSTNHIQPAGKSGNSVALIVCLSVLGFLLLVAAAIFFILKSRAARNITSWKTGLSGQLQKAFITGVPKLNRDELETACEDFSNIIKPDDGVSTVYKGTLSSGVEIYVASTSINSLKDWSKRSELIFRKKIDTLSRVNHKNFLNLIGYCEEDQPFTRMMVFEYAPNGYVYEHLHDQELENLDWSARMRIIMGTAYCLQHMHDLNPPLTNFNVTSKEILLTDDYAAKIVDINFWAELISKSKNAGENDASEHSELPLPADVETNVHCFGILMLEMISGKLPYSEEQGHLTNWAAQNLTDKKSISCLVDPSLKSFKENELDIVCEVIQSCIQPEVERRPSMTEVIQRLREVIAISPEQATPRLSPLWWAELEILSAEAA